MRCVTGTCSPSTSIRFGTVTASATLSRCAATTAVSTPGAVRARRATEGNTSLTTTAPTTSLRCIPVAAVTGISGGGTRMTNDMTPQIPYFPALFGSI